MTGKALCRVGSIPIFVLLLTLAGIQPAQSQIQTKDFNVPAQSATTGIPEFARQAGIQILVSEPLVRGKRIAAVTGSYSVPEALAILLRGTGLSATSKDGATYTVGAAQPPPTSLDSNTVSGMPATLAASDDSKPGLEEIIVTAQKRSERLQDVPVPVTALSPESLLAQNQLRIQDYYTSVPGLNLDSGVQGNVNLSIRGLTTGANGGNPTVAIVIDDAPYGSSSTYGSSGASIPDLDPGDLTRIEVLRGPQGTLYGSSSIGGLIKFETIDPSTDRFSGHVQAGLSGVVNGNELGYGTRGSVNVPLSDTWAIRASAFNRRDPGYIDDPVRGIDGVNTVDVSGGRVAGMWRPSDTLSLKLSALLQDTKGDGEGAVDISPTLGNLQQLRARGTGGYERQAQVYNATLKTKVAGADLTSVSGYNINHDFTNIDYSPIIGALFASGSAAIATDVRTKKFTQEIRLAGGAGPRLEWLVGAFYAHEKTDVEQLWFEVDPATGGHLSTFLDATWPTTYQEYAGFADLIVHATDRFDIQIGARQSEDRQTYSEIDAGPYGPVLVGLPDPIVTPQVETRESAFTYLLTPRFRISSDLMVYARLASGYRPGGPNATASVFHFPTLFKPDKTLNYEVGMKGDALDHRFTYDASVYYIDWKNIQLLVNFPAGAAFENGPRAKSQGVELSAEFRPLQALRLSSWIAFNDAKLTKDFPAGSYFAGRDGDRLANSSRFSGNVSIDWKFPLTDKITGSVGSTLSYVGDREAGFAAGPATRVTLPSYTKLDLLAQAKRGEWTLNAFVNNAADRRGRLESDINRLGTSFVLIQPRTIGLALAKAF